MFSWAFFMHDLTKRDPSSDKTQYVVNKESFLEALSYRKRIKNKISTNLGQTLVKLEYLFLSAFLCGQSMSYEC